MGLDLLINQFGAILGLLIFIALAVGAFVASMIRNRTDASNFVQKTDSTTEKTYADALLLLARNGDTSNQIQREIGTSMREFTAELRGMLSMLDANTKATRTTAMGIDDISGQMPAIRENAAHIPGIRDNVQAIHDVAKTLETNLGGSINDQIVPLTQALRGLDERIVTLSTDSMARDVESISILQEIKRQIERAIEAFTIAHMKELLPPDPPTPDAPNGNTANPQELPVNIHITSASPTKEQK